MSGKPRRPRGAAPSSLSEEAASRLAAIVTSSEDPIIGLSLDRRITSWNAAAERLFGFREVEIVGRELITIVPKDRREELERIHGAVARGEHTEAFETVRLRKDGARVDVSVSVSPVFDAEGRVIGSAAIDRDISRRKAAEGELERQRRLLQLIVDSLPVLISYVDPDERYRLVNERYVEWFAIERDAIERLSIRELFGEEAWETMRPHVERALAGDVVRYEATLPYREGGTRDIQAEYVPDTGPDGSVRGIIALVQDVTERKAVERKLAEADRHKDEFLAMLAHELRNPMAPLVSGLTLLREHGEDSRVRAKVLPAMDRQVEQLKRLVDDLLDVSRISRGKVRLEKSIVDLGGTVRALEHDLLRPRAEHESKRLEVHLPDESLWVDADPVRLAQMIGNLATNALKYTRPGDCIRITASPDGDSVLIRVEDDGVGIEADLLPSIFELFTQGEVPLSREAGGLGIGLTMVAALAELHGGEVRAHSEGPGRGATFELRLPVVEPGAPRPSRGSAEEGELPGRRVLLVEDDAASAELMALLLGRWGQTIWVAHTGEEALELAREHQPEVILVDIGLPEMDGYEVVRRLRAQERQRSSVVMLSGYGQQSDYRQSREAGADGHLIKPADPAQLRAVLRDPPRREGAP